MKPAEAMALHKRLVDAFPTVRSLASGDNPKEWRSWFEALPFEDAARALTIVIAGSDFPTVHQFLAACGFDCGPQRIGGSLRPITPAFAMLMAARDGGYELVRDHDSPHGWRSSRPGLPEPEVVPVPCPPEVKAQMREALNKISERTVPPIDTARNASDRRALEYELAAADARFNAELARAEASERGDGREVEVEDLLPY